MIKYIKKNTIEIEKKSSELSKWKELSQILHKTWQQCGENREKWIKLAGSESRTYDCFLSEVENTIKNLGG